MNTLATGIPVPTMANPEASSGKGFLITVVVSLIVLTIGLVIKLLVIRNDMEASDLIDGIMQIVLCAVVLWLYMSTLGDAMGPARLVDNSQIAQHYSISFLQADASHCKSNDSTLETNSGCNGLPQSDDDSSTPVVFNDVNGKSETGTLVIKNHIATIMTKDATPKEYVAPSSKQIAKPKHSVLVKSNANIQHIAGWFHFAFYALPILVIIGSVAFIVEDDKHTVSNLLSFIAASILLAMCIYAQVVPTSYANDEMQSSYNISNIQKPDKCPNDCSALTDLLPKGSTLQHFDDSDNDASPDNSNKSYRFSTEGPTVIEFTNKHDLQYGVVFVQSNHATLYVAHEGRLVEYQP